MTMTAEIPHSDIASHLAGNGKDSFENLSDVIYILTDWYRSYQMVGPLEGQDSYQFVARNFGKWLAETEDEYHCNRDVQVAFCKEVVKSYNENIKRK